ncbi:phage tail tube protein [Sinorhizobium sp. CCBAU 05631]|uniref:phage tail tube protein n=1 Tax=Sinorhizobium sp. CCBAU 05631 TaxID=794846 RepID=UPI0004ADAB74|nr:phage tail tube protein [Sinorhizobium sp. CCBAU 05631]ASY56491.1 Phage protein [Sinorhizobium sp. CCBAU 05631]
MVKPVTEKFEELVLDVEFDPVGSPGVYTRICGILDATVTRTANVDTSEVPGDCDDESVPVSVERQVRSIEVTVSGTGVWAQQSQGKLKNWFYSAATLNTRVRDTNAASGDTEVESGPALLTGLTTGRTKGQKVSAEIEIQFDGTPTRTAAA